MKLETAPRAGSVRRKFLSRFSLRKLITAALACAALGFALLTGVAVGVRLEENGNGETVRSWTQSRFVQNVLYPALSTVKGLLVDGQNVPFNWIRGLTATEVPHLEIDIKHLDYEKLARKRAEALKLGVLFSDRSDYVGAGITLGGQSEKGKLRLKGDMPDHYETDKWSLRIRLQGDRTLLGMKTFSIQHPITRNFIGEWVLLEALRREDILAPRYRFVDVTINGRHMGIYALEEHFDKRLVEHASRREGPVIKFDEDLMWRAYQAFGSPQIGYGAFASSSVDGWAADKAHGSAFERGVALLEGFRRGALATTEVFDGEKLATFLAMRDLGGAPATLWQNLRFYLNPVTSKLEPIGFDNEVDPTGRIDKLFGAGGGVTVKAFTSREKPESLMRRIFDDLEFFALYVKALERLSDPDYLAELFADIGSDFDRELAVLHREYPYYRGWSDDFLIANQAFIREALSPPTAIHAYHEVTTQGEIALRIGNVQSLPIEILGVSAEGAERVAPRGATVLRSKRFGEAVAFQTVAFQPSSETDTDWAPAGLTPGDLVVHYRVLGTETERSVGVHPWAQQLDAVVAGSWIRSTTDPAQVPFLHRERETGSIVIRPGRWSVDETLVLRSGPLVAGPGVHLDLREGAKIIVFAPLTFRGNEDDPVVVESSDGTGQGLLVIGADAPSELRHVVFDNLSELHEEGWSVPGAVTFYESPVNLQDVAFRRSRSEDALNIMRTSFSMTRTAFVDAGGDAFDGDFVTGRILDSGFAGTGNDAIDVSGSVIRIERVRMEDIGDKALSAGEHSEVEAEGLRIVRAELGVASKDLSRVDVGDIAISETAIGFAAFQKKSEFGAASIEVRDARLTAVEQPFLIEEGSRAVVDGEVLAGDEHDVGDQLYRVDLARGN